MDAMVRGIQLKKKGQGTSTDGSDGATSPTCSDAGSADSDDRVRSWLDVRAPLARHARHALLLLPVAAAGSARPRALHRARCLLWSRACARTRCTACTATAASAPD